MAENADDGFELVEDDDDVAEVSHSPTKCSNNFKLNKQWIGDDCNQPSTSGICCGKREKNSNRKRDSNTSPQLRYGKKLRLDLADTKPHGLCIDTPVHQLLNSAAKLDKCPTKNWSDDDEDDIQYLNRLSTNRRNVDSWRDIDHTDSEAEDADASGQSTADGIRTLSDSEVDRDRKAAPVKRQRSSRTIVLSDSESESPCPRIKKSPRCQIFPRQPLQSPGSRSGSSPRHRARVPVLVGGMKLDVDVRERSVERMQVNASQRRTSSISPLIFPDEEDEDVDMDYESDYMDPVMVVQQMEEDENLARRLQAEFDAEIDQPLPRPIQRPNAHHSNQRALRSRRAAPPPDTRVSATFRVNNNQFNVMDNAVTTLPLRIELRPTPQGTRVAFQRPPRATRGGRWDAWNLLFTDIDDDYEGLLDLADLMGEVRRKGLTETEIGQLPTREVAREQILKRTPSGTRVRCHICMCDYEVGEEIRSLTCFHEFHSACIDRWLRENASCPICRAEVKLSAESI